MHFVTGGAFNGKRAWVKEKYPDAFWLSAYRGDSFSAGNPQAFQGSVIVFEGLEAWVRELIKDSVCNEPRSYLREFWGLWRSWEKQDSLRRVVVIGTDISKGIVPIEKDLRTWRDNTGWVYQDLAKQCEQVDVIWYGISQTLKGER